MLFFTQETELHLSAFIEQVRNDPDSFGTKLILKEAFDSIMQEAKQRLPPTHPERIKVGSIMPVVQ